MNISEEPKTKFLTEKAQTNSHMNGFFFRIHANLNLKKKKKPMIVHYFYNLYKYKS